MKYARGVARSGGSMHGTGRRYVPVTGRANADPLRLFARATPHGTGVCPVCRFTVPLRKNGDIGAHRVGRAMATATSCPGVDTALSGEQDS